MADCEAYIAGIFEHPTRLAIDKSVPQLHAEVAAGALADAGLSKSDIDGYFCAGDAPGIGPLSMVEYLGLKVRHTDSTGHTHQTPPPATIFHLKFPQQTSFRLEKVPLSPSDPRIPREP